MTAPADPLVVTLQLDDAGARFFEAARQQHFPADRNQIPAHVSLFHALPGEHLDEVSAGLEAMAVRFDPWLTAQDSQALRPHVTVQNTVDADTARQTHAALGAA